MDLGQYLQDNHPGQIINLVDFYREMATKFNYSNKRTYVTLKKLKSDGIIQPYIVGMSFKVIDKKP